MPPVLLTVMDAIASVATNTQLFGDIGERLAHQGEAYDITKLPAAGLTFGDETADELIQTGKLGLTLPWTLEVIFDNTAPGQTIREKHTRLAATIRDAFMNDRSLGGTAIDTSYQGGSSELTPEDVEGQEPPARWSFRMRFETIYRSQTTDASAQA